MKIILIIMFVSWIGLIRSIRNAQYFDEETNRFIPKSQEKEYIKRQQEQFDNYIKENEDIKTLLR